MKKDKYIRLQNQTEADDFIGKLDQILGEHWADARVNPCNGKAIVPWNNEYLKKASYLLRGKKEISPEQATEQEMYFGHHQGFFTKAGSVQKSLVIWIYHLYFIKLKMLAHFR